MNISVHSVSFVVKVKLSSSGLSTSSIMRDLEQRH